MTKIVRVLILGAAFAVGCTAPGPQTTTTSSLASPSVSASASAPEGWKAYRTRDESIAVYLPEEATSRPQPVSAMPGAYSDSFLIQIGDKNQTRFFAVSWSLMDPPDAEKALQEFVLGSETKAKHPVDVGGHKGVEAVVMGSRAEGVGSRATVRIVEGKGRVFWAVCGGSPAAEDPATASQTKTFLESFRPQADRPANEDPPVAIEWKEWKSVDGSLTCMVPDDFEGGPSSGGSMGPGRYVLVHTAPETKGDFDKLLAEINSKAIISKKPVERNGLKGFEIVLAGITNEDLGHPEWFQTHVQVLAGSKHVYFLSVAGLKGDKSLEADARKIFDSVKPGK